MYSEHFGLNELPFSIAPDPRYLYLSEHHREALAHLVYGINSEGGFVLLTGEVGTGKTTVCRCLLEQLPEKTDVAFIYNPKLTVEELLAAVCDELGIAYPEGNRSIKVFTDCINAYLLDNFSKGRKTVIILEEAQNLGADVLEEIRLLTNLETNRQKLLQIIMVGQPELREMLSRPELRQLSQRITARYHLDPLTEKEIGEYVNHRLEVAGAKDILFPEPVIRYLYRLSKGIPRLINLICDRALLGTYVQGNLTVDKKTLMRASREVLGNNNENAGRKMPLKWIFAIIAMIICGAAIVGGAYYQGIHPVVKQRPAVPAEKAKDTESIKLDNLTWNSAIPAERSRAMAFDALLKEWGIAYQKNSGVKACRQIRDKGLRCLEGNTSLDQLILMNRPAVVKLNDEKGRGYYAAIKAIHGVVANVTVGNENRSVDMQELRKRFLGEYALIWKIPPDYYGTLYPGASSPVMPWIDKKMAIMQNRKPRDSKNLAYTRELVDQVKAFQTQKGISPGGLIGPQTIIQLNNASGSDEPKLTMKGKGT
jgi:general secretion pathway protein A